MNYHYSIPLKESKNITVKSDFIQNKLLPYKIETNNLHFKPAWQYNTKEIYSLYKEIPEKSIKYIPGVDVNSLNDVIEHNEKNKSKYNKNISCKYIMEYRNKIVGHTGIHVDWDKKLAGYYIWIKPKYWGNSYSKERGIAFTSIMFEILDLDTVKISSLIDNVKSRKAIWKYMKELGGYPTGLQLNSHNVTDSSDRDDTIEFTVTKDDFYNSLYTNSSKTKGIEQLKELL